MEYGSGFWRKVIMRHNNFKLFDTRIDAIQIPQVLQEMEKWIGEKNFGNYICISNMNDIAYGYKDEQIKKATNAASLSVPDGMSLVFLARLKGFDIKERVYGADLMQGFFKMAVQKGYRNYFYGGSEEALKGLTANVKKQFPQLKIAGFYSPPFRPLDKKEKGEIIDKINEVSPDVLWVGLGCPKQQLWMSEHRGRLKVPVMVGVGAAFDFLSGNKKQAPKWMRNNGLEWLFRLVKEPKRLWKRYLIGNTIFVWLVLKELGKKLVGHSKPR